MSRCLTVNYNGKPCYDIIIEKDFLRLADEFLKLKVTGKKICIVTDDNAGPIYAEEVSRQLAKTGNSVYIYTIKSGEENKTLETVQEVYEFLIKNRFDRTDMLAALGGGVVGDLTGYTAATYLRGISFIQIPTTLLAQVDSSIGGKTGVDFKSYKNMVGAFHMPKLVYSNISTLKTLSQRLFNSGLGEIIKHGLIKDYNYYKWIADNLEAIKSLDMDALSYMIYISNVIKKNVVELDPTEKGDRALLNFGHTLGHAVEKLMDFSLYHGECVVLGMIAALDISVSKGFIGKEEYSDAVKLFEAFDFPVYVTGINPYDVVEVSKNDKKMVSGKVKFILLRKIGDAFIDTEVSEEEMISSLGKIIR